MDVQPRLLGHCQATSSTDERGKKPIPSSPANMPLLKTNNEPVRRNEDASSQGRYGRRSTHLYLFKGSEDFCAQGVVVVVDHVFNLSSPVDDDALQMLNEILRLRGQAKLVAVRIMAATRFALSGE